MLTKFYESWGTARALIITLSVLYALGVCAKAHAWNLEMEYTGPGSHAEQLDRECRDRDNREAHERHMNGSDDSRDVRGSIEHDKDHAA